MEAIVDADIFFEYDNGSVRIVKKIPEGGGWQIRGEALQAPKEVEFGEGWCCGGGQPPPQKIF